MKINIAQIPDEGIEIKTDQQVVTGDGEPLSVKLDLLVEGIAGEVFIKGEASMSLALECDRCLKETPRELSIRIDLAYCHESDLEFDGKDHEVTPDEIKTGFYTGDELDIGEMISEQVLLNVPMKSVCSDSCKGICPKCGNDLNERDCGCDAGSIDPRFHVLEEYLKKKKE